MDLRVQKFVRPNGSAYIRLQNLETGDELMCNVIDWPRIRDGIDQMLTPKLN